MITAKRIQSCLATIEAIASSSAVEEYLIGYTRQPAGQKGDAYRRLDFKHFVILADKMTRADGLRLDQELQRRTMGDPSSAIHSKYHHEKRLVGRIFESSGGSTADPLAREASVYIVWW